MKLRLLIALLLFAPAAVAAEEFDVEGMIEALVPHEGQPRILNALDVPNLSDNALPMLAPEGDFDGDGTPDVAISGVYGLPTGKMTHFLIVGTRYTQPVRYKKLFFQENVKPVYLFRPGTTGEADPGNQAFSTSFCTDCNQGFDFYWNKATGRFDLKPWSDKTVRLKKTVTIPAEEIPQATIDKALAIIGKLPDIKEYVKKVQEGGGTLGTRVTRVTPKKPRYAVQIFQRLNGKELPYDDIIVNVEEMKIIKRGLKISSKGAGKHQ